MKRVIAIDLGASSGLLMLAELKDQKVTLKKLHRFPNGPIEKDGDLFWDINSIINEIKIGLKKYGELYNEPLDGIGVDTWGVDFGLVSDKNLLIGNPYSYRGSHTDGVMEKVHEIFCPFNLFKKTGVESAPINTLYQLAGLSKEKPALLKQSSVILTMPSLINFLLTGKKVNEYTHATTTQLMDHVTQDWSNEIINTIFSEKLPLAEIKPTNTIIGTTTKALNEEIGLKPISVINVPGHDTACAVVALPIKDKQSVFMSCGTWVLIGTEVDEPVVTEKAYEWGFTNEGTVNKKYRLQKNNMGLWLLQQVKKEWEENGESVSFEEEESLLNQATPFKSLIDPDDYLFFNPHSMVSAIQEFCKRTGQIVPQTKGDVIRCILESLSLKYSWIIKRLEKLTNKKVENVYMGGGGIQNKILCQFVADATNKRIIAGPIEASAIGNALSQFIALGEVESLVTARKISAHSFKTSGYKPLNSSEWDEAYEWFTRLM